MAASGVAYWDQLLGVFLTVDVGPGLYRPDPTGSEIAVKADGTSIIVTSAGIRVDPAGVGVVAPTPNTLAYRTTDGSLRATSFIAGTSVLVSGTPVAVGATAFSAVGPWWSQGDVGPFFAARRWHAHFITSAQQDAVDGDALVLDGASANVVLPSIIDEVNEHGTVPQVFVRNTGAAGSGIDPAPGETIMGGPGTTVPAGACWLLIGDLDGNWNRFVAS